MIEASALEAAFPEVAPGVKPLGTRVLVQLRTVKTKTAGGIILAEDTRDFNKANTQLAKVVAMGQIAYCNRDTGGKWPEGVWCQVGDFVRIPKFGGDRFSRVIPDTEDKALFALFSDHEIIAQIEPDAFTDLDEIL